MRLRFPRIIREHFGIRLFSFFTCFIFIVSLSFTAFFYHYQRKSLTDILIQNNLILAGVLAHNSRIGVFSENEKLLENPIEGVFQQEETEVVSVYNMDGEVLKERKITGSENADGTAGEIKDKIFDIFKTSPSPYYFNNKDTMEFWSPVIASSGYPNAESLFLDDKSLPTQKHIIGFVRIIVGKSVLSKKLDVLLMRSVLIGLVSLLTGCAVIYFIVIRIVNPLNRLTKGVQALGEGDFGKKVPVETGDEIGRLALAFNQMSESLHRREAEKEQLETQLRQAQKMEAIGTLAGGIAHDFNNILGIIMGFTELSLHDTPKETLVYDRLTEALKATNRAKDLVKQILTFSRQGRQEANPLAMGIVIKEALKMLRASLPTTIEIQQNIERDTGLIMADPTQIHQVIMNLATNAYHAMGEKGGVLNVSVENIEIDDQSAGQNPDLRSGSFVKLTVSDTSHGMAPEVMERIFDPYYTTKEMGKGTGLGLSVVHGIALSHEGVINVHSEPGKGTAFEVLFPRIDLTGDRAEIKEEENIPTGFERILFVDDEPAMTQIYQSMLERLGYAVSIRTSSIEALEAFKAQPGKYDLVITDQTMPHLTGQMLAKEMITIRPDIPVILCTGHSDLIDDDKAKEMGVHAFVMKPIAMGEIARTIRDVLDK